MKTILSILILALVLNSCKKEEPISNVIDTHVGITVHDKVGKDLLNPATPGAFLAKDIRIFYLTNGIKEEVYYPTADIPRNFRIDEEAEPDGNFWMTLFLNASPDDEFPVTYVQWSKNDTDTLKCDVFNSEGVVMVKNIWLNDSLVWKWEDYANGPRNIEIIK